VGATVSALAFVTFDYITMSGVLGEAHLFDDSLMGTQHSTIAVAEKIEKKRAPKAYDRRINNPAWGR
jgi:hypothetical protein